MVSADARTLAGPDTPSGVGTLTLMRLDHVIYGTQRPRRAQRRSSASSAWRCGPAAVTRARARTTGSSRWAAAYLELMAIRDREEAAAHPFGQVAARRRSRRAAGRLGGPGRRRRRHRASASAPSSDGPARHGLGHLTGVQEALREPRCRSSAARTAPRRRRRRDSPGSRSRATRRGSSAWLGGRPRAAAADRRRRARAARRRHRRPANSGRSAALRELLAQRLLGELADRGLGHLLDDLEVVRDPPLRARARRGTRLQLVERDLLAALGHDARQRALATTSRPGCRSPPPRRPSGGP